MRKIASHLLVGADTASGVIIYVVASLLFGEEFVWWMLLLTIFAAHAPDADFVPYLLYKKRMRWISHRVVGHHPLILLPLVALVGWGVAGWYGCTLAVMAVTAHLVHDTMEPDQGFHWLSPFSWWSFTIATWPPRVISEDERRAAHAKLAERTKQGGEVSGRLAGVSSGEKMYAFVAYFFLIAFSFAS